MTDNQSEDFGLITGIVDSPFGRIHDTSPNVDGIEANSPRRFELYAAEQAKFIAYGSYEAVAAAKRLLYPEQKQ